MIEFSSNGGFNFHVWRRVRCPCGVVAVDVPLDNITNMRADKRK